MTASNVEVVRAVYAAWARQDLDGAMEAMHPDVEYVNPERALEPGTRRGAGAFRSAVERVFEGWETWVGEPEELRGHGDHVVAIVSYRARGKQSGLEVEGRESALWTLRDGTVVRYEWFHDVADAEEALTRVTERA
jgi:uncharacterized protein